MRRPWVALSLAVLWLLVARSQPFNIPSARADVEGAQTFHIMEITKIMVGFNGDNTIQAVEMKMLAGGQNLVGSAFIETYDGSGAAVANLGTFGSAVTLANALTGDHVLCATAKFRDTFGITPDLLITPGIPVTSGQISFEKVGCRVNTIPYGNVATPLTSPTVAPPLPSDGATALVRVTDDSTLATCPLHEHAAENFRLRSGSAGNPIVFFNNARQSVNVFTTVAGVGDSSPPAPAFRASPNPFTVSTTLEFSSAPRRVLIRDVRGRSVRTWPGLVWAMSGWDRLPSVLWDGRDDRGRPVAAGLYFIEATFGADKSSNKERTARGRVLLIR
jgi:hypothetical protein